MARKKLPQELRGSVGLASIERSEGAPDLIEGIVRAVAGRATLASYKGILGRYRGVAR